MGLYQARQHRRAATLQRLRVTNNAILGSTVEDIDALLHNRNICVHTLRNTLHSDTVLLRHAAQRGVVSLLLRRGYLAAATTHTHDHVLDALAILINLAVVAPAATLQAVPAVAELLQGGYGAALASDAAWVLGNVAGSSPEARTRLRQAGCVSALWRARATPNALWALGLLTVDRLAADQLAHEEGCGDELAPLVVADEDAAWVTTNLLAHGWLLRGLVEALLVAGGPAAVRGLGYAATAPQVGKRLVGLQVQAMELLMSQAPGLEVAWALANWCGIGGDTIGVDGKQVAETMHRSLHCSAIDDDDDDVVIWARSMVSWFCK